MSRALALAKASVFRIVATLEMEGFVERVERDAFRVGRAAFEVGSAYAAYADMESVFRIVAQRLVAEHNETVQLAVLAGTENIYVGKEDSSQPVRLVSQLGTRLPAHITGLGKAMLSCLSESELQALYGDGPLPQMAPNSHTSLTSLLEDLRQIRVRGWAHDNEETAVGLQCVASPILDSSGRCIAAVSIAAPTQRMSESRLRQLGSVVAKAASEISALMGYRGTIALADVPPPPEKVGRQVGNSKSVHDQSSTLHR